MKRPPAYTLYRWLWRSLDWLYPPECGGCGAQGVRWCAACQGRVSLAGPPLCERCGGSLPGEVRQVYCRACRAAAPHYTQARSWAAFDGPVRSAVHRLKYRRDLGLGDILAQPLIDIVRSTTWQIDLAVPVPLGLARLRERGYNQAAILARPLAWGLGIPYQPQALRKIRETRTQVHLNMTERRSNVAGAFEALPGLAAGRSVLVVDDVFTSGATLDECARALLEAGARRVYGVTVARALGRS